MQVDLDLQTITRGVLFNGALDHLGWCRKNDALLPISGIRMRRQRHDKRSGEERLLRLGVDQPSVQAGEQVLTAGFLKDGCF
jgi:hypothetical protein